MTPFWLPAHGYRNDVAMASIESVIDTAVAQGTALVLNFHEIGSTASVQGITTANFESIVAYVENSGAAVATMTELVTG